MERGETRYAPCGDVHLAYQVVGDADVDLVWMPHWATHVEMMWEDPRMSAFIRGLTEFARVILFDRRGVGLSDPVPLTAIPTIETWVDDVGAVLDAVGVHDAVLGASDLAATTAILFAASHPERTSALVLVNATGRILRAPDYPEGIAQGPLRRYVDRLVATWGIDTPELMDPTGQGDKVTRRFTLAYQRATASPGTIAAMIDLLVETDVRDVLRSIQAPTLVVHRSDDQYLPVSHGRYLAERIPHATFVEVPGADHTPEVGDARAIVDALQRWITGREPADVHDRVLATVLFTDIVDSTATATGLGDRRWLYALQRHNDVIRRQLERFGGTEVRLTGDGVVAIFDGPARAIRCAIALRDALRALGMSIRVGLHTGEISRIETDIAGIGVHVAARVSAIAGRDQVLVSRTVKDLVAGSGIGLASCGVHGLKGVEGEWELFEVESS